MAEVIERIEEKEPTPAERAAYMLGWAPHTLISALLYLQAHGYNISAFITPPQQKEEAND